MTNFDIARESIASAENSEGSAMRELDNYKQGIQYSLDTMKAQWQEFSSTVLSTDLFKNTVDGATGLLNIITKISSLGGGLGGLGLIGMLFGGTKALKSQNLD